MHEPLIDRMLPAPVGGGFQMEGYWVWCGSAIRAEDGRYHLFASRWPKKYPMHPGWLIASEIVRAVSDKPEGPYEFQEVITPARGAEFWDGRSTHNPQIIRWKDKYLLYYVGTTHPFRELRDDETLTLSDCRTIVARSNKRIGVAIADKITGPWRRLDAPVLSTRPRFFDNFLVSNPAPCVSKDGKIHLVYKARSYLKPPYPDEIHGKMLFGVAVADQPEGPYIQQSDRPLFDFPDVQFEDPFIWEDEDGFNMIAKDMHGNVCGEKLGGLFASSQDGIHWEFRKDFLMYSRNVLWDDGVVREMGNLERPFLLFEDGKPTHAFFATSDGKNGGGFSNCTKTWNMVIPLKK